MKNILLILILFCLDLAFGQIALEHKIVISH